MVRARSDRRATRAGDHDVANQLRQAFRTQLRRDGDRGVHTSGVLMPADEELTCALASPANRASTAIAVIHLRKSTISFSL